MDKRHRQQRQDGLLEEPSPSPSPSADSLGEDDDLPDVRGTAPGVSASGPAPLGGGGEDTSGPAIARPRSEADMPKTWALGKRAVSPVGSTTVVEQAAVGATQLPPQRVEGALESDEGRLAPVDTGAVPPPPPPPLQRRVAVPKRLQPRSR